MVPKFVQNHKFLSHRCYLQPYDGFKASERGWFETEDSLPAKVRCKGFKGVLMMMGILVYVSEDVSGGQSVSALVPKDKFFGVARKDKPVILKKAFSNSFSVSMTFFRRRT